jgi:N-acetylglucosamine kinase-like BadF-type ATPase
MTASFLGVDAGNSKTVALVCLASGEVTGAGRSGCGDIYGVADKADAVRAVMGAADDAVRQAGIDRAALAGAAFRLAGVDWPEDAAFWDEVIGARWPTLPRRSISNDGYAAIRCGEPSGVGVSVVAGTSAAIAARSRSGVEWDLGWWSQHGMGALGLVDEALRAIYLAELDVGPRTRLSAALLDFYRLPSVTELNHWFTRREEPATYRDRTRAARVVTALAAQGEPVAVGIVREQGRRLAMYAGIAARKVGLLEDRGPVSIVLSGSVLMAPDSPVAAALLAQLDAHVPGAVPHPATLPPVVGSALDALGEAGIEVTQDTVDTMAASAPGPDFLQT